MAVFDLEERVEDALKAVFEELETGAGVFMGGDSEEITEPAILITLPTSDIPEDERGLEVVTGNRQGVVTVGVLTHSDSGRTVHRELVAKVRDCFYDSAFAEALNAVAVGVVVDRVEPVAAERTVVGNSFVTGVQAEVWFRPAPVVDGD
jgi:hypothetical protein